MSNNILVPNKSIGRYVIGDNILNYLQQEYYYEHCVEKYFEYDKYEFPADNLCLYVEKGIIQNVSCEKTCYWQGTNLIRMNFNLFLKKYNIAFDSKDEIYMQVGNRFQTQKVYDFDKLGLQVWVWRNLIRTVIVSKYDEEDEFT